MITALACFPLAFSEQSTYAITYENPAIRQIVDNEPYRAAFQAGQEAPRKIMHTNIEPLSDYQSPSPIRSYNVKLRITSKTKGLPVNYSEECEDMS